MNRFSQVPQAEIQRSSFDRSHGTKTTFNAGILVPIFVDEALPGDTFNLKMSAFGRLATPIKPIMDNMYLETFFFAVPYRLVWDNWEKFNGAQTDPGDSTDYVIPTGTSGALGHTPGSMPDHMGIPPGVPNLEYSVLPFRAADLIWNEWFRDQNMQESLPIGRGDVGSGSASKTIQRRGKKHDYFTSALPWPQKGDSVTIPLGQSAPITGIGNLVGTATGTASTISVNETGGPASYDLWNDVEAGTAIRFNMASAEVPEIYADLTDATATTINELRQAFQIQRMLEKDARGGTRYTEIIQAHFGVSSPDARLQRPEFLGGGRSMVNINPVQQTSQSGADPDTETPQGNLAAFGTVSANGHGFTKSFTEHCIVIGFATVRADITYQQGLERFWSRQTRYDFYWPSLSHLGEQPIYNREIFAVGSSGPTDDQVFGYQERYAEYRYKPSTVSGLFRSSAPESLDVWHLAQEFEDVPTLSNLFIVELPPIDRVVAVPSEPDLLFDAWFSFRCARPMPMYGTPGLIDHF